MTRTGKDMKSTIVLAVIVACAVAAVSAQSRSSSFARGTSLQSWQNPGIKNVLSKCKNPAQPFTIPGGTPANANPSPPPEPPAPPGGEAGDGSAVDAQGRLYVATGSSVDVFAANGQFLGSIPGPQGLHGTAFGGRDKKTLFGIVFYGAWGTASARNRVIAIPVLAQGYPDRAK